MSNDQRIRTEYTAAKAAAAAGNEGAADQHWRIYVGLLEVDMKRTGSIEHLTPPPKRDGE